MRVGLDLRGLADVGQMRTLAAEAEQLGLWAVLVGATPGTEVLDAVTVARATSAVAVAVFVDGHTAHPTTIAEEIAVLDHLSRRRALAVVDADEPTVDHVRRLLHAEIVDGFALAPPPAQTAMPVWSASEVAVAELGDDLVAGRSVIDARRDAGCTHLFVRWSGELQPLARHLATRAAGPDFPQIVADMADVVDPSPPTGEI